MNVTISHVLYKYGTGNLIFSTYGTGIYIKKSGLDTGTGTKSLVAPGAELWTWSRSQSYDSPTLVL